MKGGQDYGENEDKMWSDINEDLEAYKYENYREYNQNLNDDDDGYDDDYED